MGAVVVMEEAGLSLLESLASYLEKYALDFLGAAGMRCRLDLPLQSPVWQLTSDARHNLFLAYKEALNNVAKHSAATEVQIRLTLAATAFELDIADNGCGFDLKNLQAKIGGNGLANMSQRLREIGGTCDISSVPRVRRAIGQRKIGNRSLGFALAQRRQHLGELGLLGLPVDQAAAVLVQHAGGHFLGEGGVVEFGFNFANLGSGFFDLFANAFALGVFVDEAFQGHQDFANIAQRGGRAGGGGVAGIKGDAGHASEQG